PGCRRRIRIGGRRRGPATRTWSCGASLRRLGGRLGAAADAVGDLAPFGRGRVAGGAALDGLRAEDGPPALGAQVAHVRGGQRVGVGGGRVGADAAGQLAGGGVDGALDVGVGHAVSPFAAIWAARMRRSWGGARLPSSAAAAAVAAAWTSPGTVSR